MAASVSADLIIY